MIAAPKCPIPYGPLNLKDGRRRVEYGGADRFTIKLLKDVFLRFNENSIKCLRPYIIVNTRLLRRAVVGDCQVGLQALITAVLIRIHMYTVKVESLYVNKHWMVILIHIVTLLNIYIYLHNNLLPSPPQLPSAMSGKWHAIPYAQKLAMDW